MSKGLLTSPRKRKKPKLKQNNLDLKDVNNTGLAESSKKHACKPLPP